MRFLARREVAVAGKPVGLIARDFDGDGADDALALTRSPAALVLLAGGPEGLAPAAAPRPLGDDYALGPVDLGEAGFAVALQGERALLWFRSGRPDAEPLRTALDDAPRALGAGDVDGDGAAEVLVATAGDELVVVGGDGAPRVVALPPDLRGRATFLHVFSDGGGVAIGAQLGEAIYVYRPGDLASGGEPKPATRLSLDGIPRAAREADLDGDGDRELVVVGGDQSVWVLGLGSAGGPSAWTNEAAPSPTRLAAPGAVPVDLERADLDRDGRPELLLIDFYDSGYGVLGAFAPDGEPRLSFKEYAGQDPVDAVAGDFDGDGRLDLAVANRNAQRVSLLLGSGFAAPKRVPFYQAFRTPVGANPTRVHAGNLDADPLPEAIALNAGDRTLAGRNNRFGLLEGDGPLVRPELAPRSFAAGDADGDGDTDLAIVEADANGARLALYRGDGAGAFAAPERFDVAEGDVVFAREGAEAALAVLDAAGSALHLVLPASGEVRRIPLPAAPLAATAVELHSGRALAVATGAGVLLVDQAGAVSEGSRAAAPAGHRPRHLAAADFDGDGSEDLALLYAGERDTAPGRISILLRSADGFRPAAVVETGLAPARIDAGDVNGDGYAELFCAAQNSHNVNVWTRADGAPAGGGLALRRLADLGAGLGPLDVRLVDLDGDGRLDLVTANNFSHDLSVAYNLARGE
ncbi:MAG: VCBS repeat-containing protein [Planctomycetota bacterium]